MSFFKGLLQKKRIIRCQHCQQQLRIPIKAKSALKVTCPKCRATFTVKFVNPLSELVKWDKKKTTKQNVISIYSVFDKLPKVTRIMIILFFVSLTMFISSFISNLSSPKQVDTPTVYQEEGLNI